MVNKQFEGKVAVITGAARGIGRAVALAFAREGAKIAGIDICATVSANSGVKPSTPQDLMETKKQVEALQTSFESYILDQRDLKALRKAVDEIEKKFGGIDIVFANAGIQAFKPLIEMEDDDWNIQIDVNLTGTANVIRAFAPALIKRGGGKMIVTTSTQGRHGTKFGSAYSASKWGIIGLMKSAALELGEYGITVNALVPGLIDTELTKHEERYTQVLQDGGRTSIDPKTVKAEAAKILAARSPLGVPWLEANDLAPTVLFLASDAARMVTGATFEVTGGDSARNAT